LEPTDGSASAGFEAVLLLLSSLPPISELANSPAAASIAMIRPIAKGALRQSPRRPPSVGSIGAVAAVAGSASGSSGGGCSLSCSARASSFSRDAVRQSPVQR
jgi:hypothetical protein